MRNLVLTALLFGAALQATGCIFVEDDDDDGGPGPTPGERGDWGTRLTAQWTLSSGGDTATCRPGTNAAATLYACPGEADDCVSPTTQTFADVGDCTTTQNAGTITVPLPGDPSLALPPGRYSTWMEFSSNGSVYAKSFSETIDLVANTPKTVTFDTQVDHGFVDAAWTLVRGNTAVQCNQVAGLDAIVLNVSPCVDAACASTNEAELVASEFDCEPLLGRSNPIPFNGTLGFATATAAETAAGAVIGAPAFEDTGPFEYGNHAHFIGTVAIEVP